jgi:hypothetical protein
VSISVVTGEPRRSSPEIPVTFSRRESLMRSTSPVYFIAFVILAALVCIVLPLALTHGR